MSITAQELPASQTSPHGTLDFTMNTGAYPDVRSFTITKYRLWYVSSGDLGTKAVFENPRGGLTTYTNNNGQTTSSSGPYYATLNWSSSVFQSNQAAMVRVCFEGFDVEAGYDYVHIEDKTGQVVEILTGTLGNVCSAWVQGDKVQVKLYTDYSVVRYGFDIVRIEAKKGPDILARFPGQWYDPHTEVCDPNTNALQHAGLHYNWHRYYDPNVGRYITPDPLGLEAGMNLYAYAENDPVNHIDPDGLDVIYWYWSFWNNRTYRGIPHVGIQITPSLRKNRIPQLHAERSKVWPIFFDWSASGMGTEFNRGIGYYYRFETSSEEDMCIIKSAVSKMVHCKNDKQKNSSSCKYNPATNNCFQWISQTLASCGVYLDFAQNNYNPRHIRLRPVRRPIATGSYNWAKLIDLGKVKSLDPLTMPLRLNTEIRRMYGSQAANSIDRITKKGNK